MKDIVFYPEAIQSCTPLLDRHAIADQDVVFDEYVVANVAVAAYCRLGQDVGERPDACTGADFGRLA